MGLVVDGSEPRTDCEGALGDPEIREALLAILRESHAGDADVDVVPVAADTGAVVMQSALVTDRFSSSLDELHAGERVAVLDGKEDPLDFVLWKSAKPTEPDDATIAMVIERYRLPPKLAHLVLVNGAFVSPSARAGTRRGPAQRPS